MVSVKRKANGLNKFATSAAKRRRTVSNTTKVRFQAPTARNQRKQILNNARRINSMAKIVYNQRVYCDWQKFGTMYADIDPQGSYTTTWGVTPLTQFSSWTACLRKDANVAEAAKTYVKRMALNFRYSLNASSWAQYNVFICTLRRDSANLDPSQTDPSKADGDFIESPEGFNIRLNSAKYKVHYARYLTLTENTLFQAPLQARTAGDPRTTYSKGQVNLQTKMSVRSPAGTNAWTTIDYTQQPHWQRYFLMVYIVQGQETGVQSQAGARFDYDMLATTINSD